jgi:hypothetical protein
MAPVITSLSPNNGTVGTHVLISGSGFISGGFHGVVQFAGGVFANMVFSYTNTSIVVAVPAGAITGPVFLELVNVDSNSLPFTVIASPMPHITSLVPSSGGIGTTVNVNGTGFGVTQGTSTITVNGIAATVNSWSDTLINITIPSMATTGPVIVTVGGVASNSVTFTVTNPSNGGMASPLNLLLIPCQQFGTQEVLSFDTFNFNDNSFGSFYNWKVEEIAAGRTPSCTRQIIIFRDLGTALITATLSGYNQNLEDNPFTSVSETFVIGTAGATQKLGAVVRGLSLTAQNLQYTITRGGGAGPVSITKVRLEGRVEMTAYA